MLIPVLAFLCLFHTKDGGHIHRSPKWPTLAYGVDPSRFRIIPLENENENDSHPPCPIPLIEAIQDRSEYLDLLISCANNPNQKVVIQDEKGLYLSCRRKFKVTDSSLAEYRDKIGAFEKFQIQHNVAKGTFSFRSHNDLYLHYNKQIGIVAFKPKTMDWATWLVRPVGMMAAVAGADHKAQNSQHLVFLGVVNREREFLIQRTAELMGPSEWNTDFETIHQRIMEDLPEESCSIFEHPITNHQWCVTKYDADTVAIVISSEGFPQSLATECHDDLTLVYQNSQDPKKIDKMQELGLNKDRILGKELAGLMMEYDEQYYASVRSAKLTKAQQDLKDLQGKMEENIRQLQSNTEDIDSLVNKSDELLEMSKLFKKQTEQLPTKWKRATILLGTGLGAGAGALVGWLVGGPGGAMVLATEGLEIGATAVAVGILGGRIAATNAVSFWSRKFVKLVIQ